MPKMKTRRSAAKRFKKTASGEFKHFKNFKSHILEHKSPARKRNLRKARLPLDLYRSQIYQFSRIKRSYRKGR